MTDTLTGATSGATPERAAGSNPGARREPTPAVAASSARLAGWSGVAARFEAKLRHDGEHRVWTGATTRGLGAFKLDGRTEKAPRVAWLLEHGALPTAPLERICDTPGCVTPAHHRLRGQAPPLTQRSPARQTFSRAAKGRGRRAGAGGGLQGHIRERSPGAYTVELVAGRDPLDPRRRRRVTFTVHGTMDDVRRAVEEFHGSARVGARPNQAAGGTFGELLDLWLEHARIEDSTKQTYRGYIDAHIRPALGHVPVRELTTYTFDRFYAELARRGGRCRHCWWRARHGLPPLRAGERYQPGKLTADPDPPPDRRDPVTGRRRPGPKPKPPTLRVHEPDCARGLPLSPATERQVHAIIHRALEQARRWKLITANPADHTSRSPVPLNEVAPPAAADVARLVGAAFADERRFGLFLWMTVITQGRRGETCGLRWDAIDFATGELRIQGTLERDRSWKPYPKNRKGRRIRLDALTLALLAEEWQRQWQDAARCGAALRADGWVFAHPLSPDGAAPERPDALSARFRQLCERLGVSVERGLYGLRHFGATDLVRAGVDIRTVAGRLGNDPTVALRRYVHFQSDADAAAVQGLADRLAALLELPPPG